FSNYFIYQERAKTLKALEAEAIQQKLAQKAYESEAKHRQLAEENFLQARRMLDLFTQLTEQELADYPEAYELPRKLLETALRYYQDFIQQAADNPALQKELGSSHFRVARILHEIGEEERAQANLRQAVLLQERLVKNNPNDTELQNGLK